MATKKRVIEGILVSESGLSLAQISRACDVHADWIVSLVEEGILDPRGRGSYQWRFSAICLRRARSIKRLQRDLGLNLAGAALAVELMEEVDRLRARLRQFEEF